MTPALHWNPYVVPPHTLPEIGKPWSVCAVHVWRGAALATEGRNPAATAIRSDKATTRFLVIVCWRMHTTEGSGRTAPPVPTRPGCAPAQDGMQSQGNAMLAPLARWRRPWHVAGP